MEIQPNVASFFSQILAVTLGPASVQDVLRHALGLGADRALHVKSDIELQPLGKG